MVVTCLLKELVKMPYFPDTMRRRIICQKHESKFRLFIVLLSKGKGKSSVLLVANSNKMYCSMWIQRLWEVSVSMLGMEASSWSHFYVLIEK